MAPSWRTQLKERVNVHGGRRPLVGIVQARADTGGTAGRPTACLPHRTSSPWVRAADIASRNAGVEAFARRDGAMAATQPCAGRAFGALLAHAGLGRGVYGDPVTHGHMR